MQKSSKILLNTLRAGVALLVLAAMTACGSRQFDLIASGKLALEPHIDQFLRVPPEIYEGQGDLVISGRLERAFAEDLPGHICVAVVAPDDTIIYSTELNYKGEFTSAKNTLAPRSATFRRTRTRYGSSSLYSLHFPVLPPQGSIVRVRHIPEAGTASNSCHP